ncbi:MAG: hypothetical protein DRN20_03755 [Thermoplasmata archaeon]|nr:MAG: hypothetical protein DRN20_03755 [Thermoplasmata archaeon]
MHYVGVDLAWKVGGRSPTGFAVLNDKLNIEKCSIIYSDADIISAIEAYVPECIVAIDAPLIVENAHGHRRCDRELLKMGIPLYPANINRMSRVFGGIRGEMIVKALEGMGLILMRDIIEVYPYGALRMLLGHVPKYKRMKVEERKLFVRKVLRTMKVRVTAKISAKAVANHHMFDAIICAWVAYMFASKKYIMVGDEHGFIVLPSP